MKKAIFFFAFIFCFSFSNAQSSNVVLSDSTMLARLDRAEKNFDHAYEVWVKDPNSDNEDQKNFFQNKYSAFYNAIYNREEEKVKKIVFNK